MYNTHPKLCYKILGKKSAYYTRDFTVIELCTNSTQMLPLLLAMAVLQMITKAQVDGTCNTIETQDSDIDRQRRSSSRQDVYPADDTAISPVQLKENASSIVVW